MSPATLLHSPDAILERARSTIFDEGHGLDHAALLEILTLPDDSVPDLLQLAHEVRIHSCGEEVSVEGIISLKTGGCPEDCHFCSQSGLFPSPVRAARLDIPELIEAARRTVKTGATEFCIIAAVKGPDERLMNDTEEAIRAILANVDIEVSVSIGILTREQARRLKAAGATRYNHNLETSRSYFPNVVTTHSYDERLDTLRLVREEGLEVCTGGIIGMGESLSQRAEFMVQLAELQPEETPINFLDPRPGTPFADKEIIPKADALRAIGAFRLALPTATLRFAGGRELTLGDTDTERGLLGGMNAVIAGNYLTTLGRPAEDDLDMLGRMQLPIRALNSAL